MIWFLVVLLILLAIGVPIFISLGLAAMVLWFTGNHTLEFVMMFQKMFTGMDVFTLMAIPFFMLAGELMNSGGLSKRLVNFSQKTIGWIHGGLGFTTVLSSMLIAAILGSASASAAMIGMIMIPEMVSKGYKADYSAALVAASGSVGPIIPPSIPLIVYGVIAQLSITKLFASGYIPGVIIGAFFMIYNYFFAKKQNYPAEKKPTFKEFVIAFKEAILTLFLPIIIMGGILGGIFTPTEAGVVAVVYAMFISMVVYREVSIKELFKIFLKAANSSAMILMVMAVASFLSWIFTMQRIPFVISELIYSITKSPFVFLLIINIVMIVVGMFLDAVSALTIMTPVLLPVCIGLGINPILFGVMLTVNLSIGVITPPVGLNLFVTSSISKVGILRITKAVLPFIALIFIVLVMMMIFPKMFLIFA
ncbi:MAG: TRAP transporter large permease [Sphaerochaetaceae bacterium]|jgi:C4-dicarboxylate transporter DctM subunit